MGWAGAPFGSTGSSARCHVAARRDIVLSCASAAGGDGSRGRSLVNSTDREIGFATDGGGT